MDKKTLEQIEHFITALERDTARFIHQHNLRLEALERKYDANQPRDDHGRWTSGGGNGSSSPGDDSITPIYPELIAPALVGLLSGAGELVSTISALGDVAAELGAGADVTSIGLEQLPEDWEVGVTGRSGTDSGIRFSDPINPESDVRIMPGNPASDYTISREPYVRWRLDGQDLDVNGSPVERGSDDAHIPLTDFKLDPKVYK